jgi:glycosyltransferase involved in cell wall biosynthesis
MLPTARMRRAPEARELAGVDVAALGSAPPFTPTVYGLFPSRGVEPSNGLDSAKVKLSAIVPTHDRPVGLQRCLETLGAQDVSVSDFEVIVIDDGSTSDIQSLVAAVDANSRFAIRYERQELGGLNGARNRGVSLAQGEILGFLDDDTLVSTGWASALVQAFASYPCAAVGGRVDLELAGPAPSWLEQLRHYLAAYDLGGEARWLEDEPVPVGANCAVRRSDFDRIGGFQPGLDRIGGSLVSNGDTEFFRRLRSRGGRLRYEPRASVLHCVPAERLTVAYFRERHRAQGISDELLLRLDGHEPSRGHQVGLAREVVKSTVQHCWDLIRRREPAPSRFLISYWTGRLAAARAGLRVPVAARSPQ